MLGIILSRSILAPCKIYAIIFPILQRHTVGLADARPLVGGSRAHGGKAGI